MQTDRGFTTPIPPRASAHPSNSPTVRSRYFCTETLMKDSDVTRIPTIPQSSIWQYESLEYEADTSFSALSLVLSNAEADTSGLAIDEIDTLLPVQHRQNKPPLRKYPVRKAVKRRSSTLPSRQKRHVLPCIDEIDTLPPDAVTIMTPKVNNRGDLLPGIPTSTIIVESNSPRGIEGTSSWTTGRGRNSAPAQRVVSRTRESKRKNAFILNPIDGVRWWLLYPGHIEFLLWLGGTIVLVFVTCLLLFAMALSAGWLSIGSPGM